MHETRPNLFRKQDAEKIAPHTGMFLTRALKKGLIHRINRENYINAFLFPVADELELEGLNRGTLIETAKQFPSSILRKMTLLLDTVFDNAV